MRASVVGAGLAGPGGRRRARAAGWEVEVLEARDRVGGRTWSRTLANGAVVEMGAEFILPGYTAVGRLAERFGLGLWDKGMRYGTREPRGGVGGHRRGARERRSPRSARRSAAGEGRPVGTASCSTRWRSTPAPARRSSPGSRSPRPAAADEVPATDDGGLAAHQRRAGPERRRRQPGPRARARRRARPRRAPRRPGRRAIEWRRGGVAVRTAAGREVDADACVVAVPATRDRRGSRSSPRCRSRSRDALGRSRYGHAAKLFVPLAEPAPPSAVLTVPERYWCWTATGGAAGASRSSAASPARRRRSSGSRSRPARALARVARGDCAPTSQLEPAAARALDLGRRSLGRGPPTRSRPRPRLTAALARARRAARVRRRAPRRRDGALMEGAIRSGRAAAASLAGAA